MEARNRWHKFAKKSKLIKMKKIFVLLLIACASSAALMAQDDTRFKFSVGPELSFATGTFADGYSFGIGATGQVEFYIQEKLYGTGTSGVIFYNGKSQGNGLKNTGLNIIPIKVGIKYFIAGSVYVGVQTGVGIINHQQGTYFAYTPLVGYEFKTNSDKALDASLKFDGYSGSGSSISSVGVRLAYIF